MNKGRQRERVYDNIEGNIKILSILIFISY